MPQFILLSIAYKYNVGRLSWATVQNYMKICVYFYTKIIVASFLVQEL